MTTHSIKNNYLNVVQEMEERIFRRGGPKPMVHMDMETERPRSFERGLFLVHG